MPDKTKDQRNFYAGLFGGRGWTSRAAHLKKPHRGFFPRRTVRRVDAVRIHPPSPREGYYKTETPVPDLDTGVLGGRGWIRTTEAESSRFTVCPHWPLGNTPIFFLQSRGLPVYVTTESVICQPIIWFGCKKYIAITKALPCGLALQRPGGRALQPDYSNSTF